MNSSLIKIENLEFSYSEKPILIIPRFEMLPGEKIFLMGPSGSGKTTFLEILSGVLSAQKGSYVFSSTDFMMLNNRQRDQVRKKYMSLIFQNFNLIPYLTVKENILLPFSLGYQDERSETEIQEDLTSMLEELGLRGYESRKVTELSQGQQQRVAAARAFLKRPQLLLADEPTSSLDLDHRESFLKVLFKMAQKQNTSIIFVSHDRGLESLFDRTSDIRQWRTP